MSPRVAIVSTSVNARPSAYADWAKQGDLIVAGDRNSPSMLEDYVRELGGTYLTPHDQESWPFSETLGWNCIQRRNAAVMSAFTQQYDFVATIDDDNFPRPSWVSEHAEHILGRVPFDTRVVRGSDGWTDIGQFNVPPVRQRGTPFGAVRHHDIKHRPPCRVVVSTAQVLGDPDCDAVTRITRNPQVTDVLHSVVVHSEDWAAFNSQATMWNGRWAPLIAVLPFVGRYDDIIASFIAKRIMRACGVSFYAGEPCVTQERNKHDFINDLKNELLGMELTPHIIGALEHTTLDAGDSLPEMYNDCIESLRELLPQRTIQFMEEWRDVWEVNLW